MQDRFLYKAKRQDNGEWVEGALFDGENYCVIGRQIKFSPNIENECKIVGYIVDRDTICQYTGLTDKNGNKICENDIVRYYDDLADMNKKDLVKWNETHASFTRLHKSQMGLQYLYIDEFIANRCEVIGNIFDNPELLEELEE